MAIETCPSQSCITILDWENNNSLLRWMVRTPVNLRIVLSFENNYILYNTSCCDRQWLSTIRLGMHYSPLQITEVMVAQKMVTISAMVHCSTSSPLNSSMPMTWRSLRTFAATCTFRVQITGETVQKRPVILVLDSSLRKSKIVILCNVLFVDSCTYWFTIAQVLSYRTLILLYL